MPHNRTEGTHVGGPVLPLDGVGAQREDGGRIQSLHAAPVERMVWPAVPWSCRRLWRIYDQGERSKGGLEAHTLPGNDRILDQRGVPDPVIRRLHLLPATHP